MAERHQLKIADRHGIAEDDPFAELTRIMGFDPREPIRPQAVATRPGQADAQGDFDIDLEKELLGEFATYDELAQAMPSSVGLDAPAEADEVPSAQVSQAGSGLEEAFFGADMDDAVTASLEQDLITAGETEPEAPVAEPEALATEFEAFADPRDDAGERYAMPEEVHAAAEQADVAEVAAALRGTWFGPAQDAAPSGTDHGLAADMAEPSFDDNGFDAAVSADLGDAFSAADVAGYEAAAEYEPAPAYANPAADEVAYEQTEQRAGSFEYEDAAPYQEPLDEHPQSLNAYRHPEQDAAVDTDDFAGHFESALADADMDFTAEPQPAVSGMSHDFPEHDDMRLEDIQRPAIAAADHGPDIGIDTGIDAAFDDAFARADPPVESRAVAQPSPEPVAARRENTLEDELNALLAKMTTRPAVSTASSWPLATPVARKESVPAASAPPPAAAAVEADEDEIHAALMADLHAMDFDHAGDSPSRDEEIDFDAEAFHAALADADDGRHTMPSAKPAPVSDWSGPAAHGQRAGAYAAPRHQEAPELETVDVPERVVALADDLDLPEVPFEEPEAGSRFYDDLDSEFADLIGKIDAAPEPTHAAYHEDAYDAGFRRGSAQPQSVPVDVARQPAAASYSGADFDADDLAAGHPARDNPFAVDELAYDPDDALALADPAEAEAARRPQRRGVLVAGLVCAVAVAVAGGLGALAMSFGGKGGAEAPALVKADDSPIKVKPENPGGTVIPNQNNKVYEAVAKGVKTAEPTQQKLVTANEDPVDVNAAAPQSRVVDLSGQADAAAAGAKSEDRVEQTAQADSAAPDVPVVTPRKVRTMVVKPDGSLVARDDPAPAVAASEPADPAPQHVVAAGDQTGAVAPAKDGGGQAATADEPALKPASSEAAVTPKTAPIAPQRPSDQPLDVVGEVKPDQVASIDAGTAAGSWSMQIASQPTAEAAQSTYQDLARRYGSVLGGQGVNIVKADIAGKGTFYRVRVPAQSRNDAIKLCESYKAAGGNCFVSK